jgi:ketosteroid isomerase-like protein
LGFGGYFISKGSLMRVTSVFLVGTILFVSTCAAPPEKVFDAAAKEEVRNAVEGRVMGYVQAMQEMDLDYMLDFFANSEDFAFDDYGSPPVGYDEYAEVLRGFAGSGSSITSLEMGTPLIVVLGPSAASCSLEYSWTMVDPEGNAISAKGTWTYVMQETGGVWRAVHSTGMHLYE